MYGIYFIFVLLFAVEINMKNKEGSQLSALISWVTVIITLSIVIITLYYTWSFRQEIRDKILMDLAKTINHDHL